MSFKALSCSLKDGFLLLNAFKSGLDVKVENFKAKKVFDHFRGGVSGQMARRVLRPKVEGGGGFKAEWLG